MRSLLTHIIFLLVGFFGFQTASAQEPDNGNWNRARFILEVYQGIESASENSDTHIGIYGRGKFYRELEDELNSQAKEYEDLSELKIRRFKRLGSVKSIELIYLHEASGIRISDLKEQLGDKNCIIVTEDFPYGSSSVNFSLDENLEVFYEFNINDIENQGATVDDQFKASKRRVVDNQDWKDRLKKAQETIENQEATINQQSEKLSNQEDHITYQSDKIDGQEDEIAQNEDEIKSKEAIISYQRWIIVVGIVSLLIISGLLFFLFRSNRSRKLALKIVEEKNREIISSIKYAQRIQRSVLPATRLVKGHLPDSFVLFAPKDIIGGDFYWLQEEEGKVYFAVADCTGHGVPGAMLTVMFSNWLTKIVKELKISDPGKILDECVTILKQRLSMAEQQVLDGMDVTLCVYDKKNNKLQFSGAHNSLYYFRGTDLTEYKVNKQAIGDHEELVPFSSHEIDVQSGDVLYLFSDGFHDQFGGEKNKKYTKKRFKELLSNLQAETLPNQQNKLTEELNSWKGEFEQIDDVCIMGVKL